MRVHVFSSLTGISLSFLLAAQSVCATPADAPGLSDREIDARLNSLTQSLSVQQTSAQYWEYGWGMFDGGTMIWSAAQAGDEHDIKDRKTNIVQAAESLIGLADVVLRPLPAFDADLACADAAAQQDPRRCLAEKQALLEASAERANEPYEVLPHLGNFGFNLAAGLIVWKVADRHHALITAIPGELIGEAQIWSEPRQPLADLEQYKIRFGPLPMQADNAKTPATGVMVTFGF